MFFVLQTWRVEVLTDHMQVHMTVKDKEINLCHIHILNIFDEDDAAISKTFFFY